MACQHCFYTFKDTSSLEQHIRDKHPEELMTQSQPKEDYPYRCSVCQKSFKTVQDRKACFRKHTKEQKEAAIIASKTVKCPRCPSMHKSKEALRKHLKVCQAQEQKDKDEANTVAEPCA